MLFSENIKIAFRALRANKMRSILTILGIVIGVATVVALLSIGEGATASITSSIQSGGSNLLTISPGKMQMGMGGQSRQPSYLYYKDYQLLERGLTHNIAAMVPVYQSNYTVKFGNESFNTATVGVMEDHAEVRSFTVAEGRFIADGDNKSQALVAVVGDTVADVESAQALGARSVAVLTGFSTRETLLATRPDALLDDLSALPVLLDGEATH